MTSMQDTQKIYHERINAALVYIQENMDQPLDLTALATVSHFSAFHFHRIFTAFMGEPVSAYVRRLRLERAAGQLVYSEQAITVIALDAGFDNSSSFSKAFKQLMGRSPREFRQQGLAKIAATSLLKREYEIGERKVKPIIEDIKEEKVLFVRRQGACLKVVPEAWRVLKEYSDQGHIPKAGVRMIGVVHDDPAVTSEANMRFDACIAGLDNPVAEGELGVQTLAGGRYAVFEHIGPYDKLDDTTDEIFGSWYPSSGITLRDAPVLFDFVGRSFSPHYPDIAEEDRKKLVTKVYVPIV